MTSVAALSLFGCVGLTAKEMAVAGEAHGRKKTILLVHGAWHGGWCWGLVSRDMENLGWSIFAPTLPGLGERAEEMNPTIGLDTHIDDIVDFILNENLTDFVMVGHSYGGMVITGVADRIKDRIMHIVYLDAALPDDGESMISYGPEQTEAMLAATKKQLQALAPDGIAMSSFPPEFLGVPKDHIYYEWVKNRLTPHPLKTWLDPIRLERSGSSGWPRTYIHCIAPVLDRTSFPFIAEQVSKDSSWNYRELQTGHDAMVTAPRAVVAILAAI